jgi:lysophospholipid acyltransferase (LPLAT)-like uncharacterized protein
VTEAAGDPIPQSRFTLRQRFWLWLITWAGFLAIRLIGPTLRYSVTYEDGAPGRLDARPFIHAFWHRSVFPAVYLTRHYGISVLTSRSFDGEYIARIISRFGFVPIRGSSNRGAVAGLLGLRRVIEQGDAVAFTIDGPRGPRFVAKPGPIALARATGVPVTAFFIAVQSAWVLKTWDAFVVPKPFSRALFRMSRPILIPADADDAAMQQGLADLQAALDRVTAFAESNVAQVGTPAFPLFRRP